MDDRIDRRVLLEEYREESRQQLDQLDRALLRLEDRGTLEPEVLLELRRALHTLKGNSAMIGLRRIADQVHAIEPLFRSADAQAAGEHIDGLFELSATVRSALDRLGTEEEESALERVSGVDLSATGTEPPPPAAMEQAGRQPGRLAEGLPEPANDSLPFPGSSELLRIPFAKLDTLLSEVGELIGFQARLDQFVGEHREVLDQLGLWRELRQRSEELAIRTSALRESTMELRLVPLRSIFGRFPNLIRELARAQGKEARLTLRGDQIELDKSTADALAEPLLHLLRNAVDHGLEEPEQRREAGKDARGTIELKATRHADRVRIEVSDDGRGLDHAAILRRAREIGVVPTDEAGQEEQIEGLIFLPGFSTRAEASTISGRGLGLDIVRQRVTQLRGSLTAESREGWGTRFLLELPLTLAIIPALLFESAGAVLAVPAADVQETLPPQRLERAAGAEVVRHDKRLVTFARAGDLLGWSGQATAPRQEHSERRSYTIVLRRGKRSLALSAERLIDQRSIMVKPLPPFLGPIVGVSGATIGPDGRVILLLDSQGLLDLNLQQQGRSSRVG